MLAFLTEVLGVYYLVSYVMTFLVINALAFLASRRFAFGLSAMRSENGLLRYYVVTAASLLVNLALLYGLVSVLGWWYLASTLLLTLLNAPANYLLHRRVTFGIRRAHG